MGALEVEIAYKRGPKSDRGVYLEYDREAHGFAIYGDELTVLFHRALSTMMSPAYNTIAHAVSSQLESLHHILCP